MKSEKLKETIIELLKTGKEGIFWDFKQEWHTNMPALLKDIICFTNTIHNKDCYIVFGVSDSLEIVGMKNTRKKQADIIDSMDKLVFATVHKPQISIETIDINGTELDVLIIYNTNKTPVFLKKQYGKMLPGCIYTRNEDRNTPDNGNAEEEQIEHLWKKRFGLTKPTLQFIIEHLANKNEWNEIDNTFYNKYRSELVLRIRDEDNDMRRGEEFYGYVQTNENMSFEILDIIANNTVLSTVQLAVLDSGRLKIPVPEWRFISIDVYNRDFISYKCYIEKSDTFNILKFFYNPDDMDQQYAFTRHMEVVLLYRSEKEQELFELFLKENIEDINNYVKENKNKIVVYTDNNVKTENYKKHILVGKCLNQMLLEFRKTHYYTLAHIEKK